jgi:hypothetical protein
VKIPDSAPRCRAVRPSVGPSRAECRPRPWLGPARRARVLHRRAPQPPRRVLHRRVLHRRAPQPPRRVLHRRVLHRRASAVRMRWGGGATGRCGHDVESESARLQRSEGGSGLRHSAGGGRGKGQQIKVPLPCQVILISLLLANLCSTGSRTGGGRRSSACGPAFSRTSARRRSARRPPASRPRRRRCAPSTGRESSASDQPERPLRSPTTPHPTAAAAAASATRRGVPSRSLLRTPRAGTPAKMHHGARRAGLASASAGDRAPAPPCVESSGIGTSPSPPAANARAAPAGGAPRRAPPRRLAVAPAFIDPSLQNNHKK